MGANMLIHSADITLFQRALQQDLRVLRNGSVSDQAVSESRDVQI